MLKSLRLAAIAGLTATLLTGAAFAEDFHGFDPTNFDGSMLSADQLAAMVVDAIKAHAPRNGEKLSIGFANLQRDVRFCLR